MKLQATLLNDFNLGGRLRPKTSIFMALSLSMGISSCARNPETSKRNTVPTQNVAGASKVGASDSDGGLYMNPVKRYRDCPGLWRGVSDSGEGSNPRIVVTIDGYRTTSTVFSDINQIVMPRFAPPPSPSPSGEDLPPLYTGPYCSHTVNKKTEQKIEEYNDTTCRLELVSKAVHEERAFKSWQVNPDDITGVKYAWGIGKRAVNNTSTIHNVMNNTDKVTKSNSYELNEYTRTSKSHDSAAYIDGNTVYEERFSKTYVEGCRQNGADVECDKISLLLNDIPEYINEIPNRRAKECTDSSMLNWVQSNGMGR